MAVRKSRLSDWLSDEYGPGVVFARPAQFAHSDGLFSVPSEGIEPPTSWFEAKRSVH